MTDITFSAQWATGMCGGRYRYYRCTKKKGVCSQGYVREDVLVSLIKERLQTISLCDTWTDYMLEKIEGLQHDEVSLCDSTGNRSLQDQYTFWLFQFTSFLKALKSFSIST